MKTIADLYDEGVETGFSLWHRVSGLWFVQVDSKFASLAMMIRPLFEDPGYYEVKTLLRNITISGNAQAYKKEDLEWME
jgi:hypothetical protein